MMGEMLWLKHCMEDCLDGLCDKLTSCFNLIGAGKLCYSMLICAMDVGRGIYTDLTLFQMPYSCVLDMLMHWCQQWENMAPEMEPGL